MKPWWFSAALLIAYVFTFQYWLERPQEHVVQSVWVIVVIMSGLFLIARSRHYFVNGWDQMTHAAVIADVALEGAWVAWHSDLSFYWCATAFVIVIGGYRAWKLRHAGPHLILNHSSPTH